MTKLKEQAGVVAHALATAANDFLVASGSGVFVKKTLAEVKTILSLGTAAFTALTDYATAGHTHTATYAPIAETCTAYHNTTQVIGSALTWTDVALNSDLSDSLGWHDPVTNNARIIPVGSNGVREYLVIVQLMAFPSNATGVRGVLIVDGSGNTWNTFTMAAVNGDVTTVTIAAQRSLATGDYIKVQVRQNSGGNLNLAAFCKVTVDRVT